MFLEQYHLLTGLFKLNTQRIVRFRDSAARQGKPSIIQLQSRLFSPSSPWIRDVRVILFGRPHMGTVRDTARLPYGSHKVRFFSYAPLLRAVKWRRYLGPFSAPSLPEKRSVTYEEVCEFLAKSVPNYPRISESIFKELLAILPVSFSLPISEADRPTFKTLTGNRGKNQQSGVYILTHKETGHRYVGSAANLNLALRVLFEGDYPVNRGGLTIMVQNDS